MIIIFVFTEVILINFHLFTDSLCNPFHILFRYTGTFTETEGIVRYILTQYDCIKNQKLKNINVGELILVRSLV